MNLKPATFETGITKIRQTIEQDDRFSGLRIESTNAPHDTMVFFQRVGSQFDEVRVVLFKSPDWDKVNTFSADVYITTTASDTVHRTGFVGKTRYEIFKKIANRFHA